MAAALERYLRATASRPFGFGTSDCVLFIADWIVARRGVDLMAGYRGRYDSLLAAEALVRAEGGHGGLPRAVGRALRRAELPRTRNPQPGDVGMVVLGGGLATCAIATRRGWALRMDDGLASLPPSKLRVVAAWSV